MSRIGLKVKFFQHRLYVSHRFVRGPQERLHASESNLSLCSILVVCMDIMCPQCKLLYQPRMELKHC